MRRYKANPAQDAFSWPEAQERGSQPALEPRYPGSGGDHPNAVLLDAEGHRWWAAFSRGKQEELIGMTAKWPEHAKELAEIAGNWKRRAAEHEAKAFQMEGL